MTVEAVAAAAQLSETCWEPIPLKLRTGADIVSMEIVDDTIYVIDSTSTAHAINVATGTHRWILDLERMPTRPVAVGSEFVAFLSKNHVTVATRSSGTPVLRTGLEFTPSSNAALTYDTLFAGAWGNGTKLRTVSVVDGWRGWIYTTDGPITSAPILVGSGADQMLYFACEDGKVVALPPWPAAATPPTEPNWIMQTLGRNSADLAYDENTIFVASEDHALYALARASGAVRWKYLDCNCPLSTKPIVVDDAVYQSFAGVVAAIDKGTGVERYRYSGAERFVTRVGQRDFLKLPGATIAVVDSQTGEELAQVKSPLFGLVPCNSNGGALIFSDGREVFALR